MRQPASESPSEIFSILYQAAIPNLIVMNEHARSMIKLFQLNEHAPEDGCGNIVVIDDAAPQQALRNALFDDYDLRLREALQLLLEAMKYENIGRGQQLLTEASLTLRRNLGDI